MEYSGGATTDNWTEVAEDLVHGGDVDQAINFLESTVSNLENQLLLQKDTNKKSTTDSLSTALQDLSKLYSVKGLSLKSDQALSKAIQIKHQKGGLYTAEESNSVGISETSVSSTSGGVATDGFGENTSNLNGDEFPQESGADDDWEAMVDRAPEELLSPQSLPGISKLSLEDSNAQGTKRRGRGTFSYKKEGLYSDSHSDEPVADNSENNSERNDDNLEQGNLIYGTRHVLVFSNFPPSTRTTDLEKVLEKFKNQFVIRWVNDTTALAVFRTPSVALEASNSIRCSFMVRVLDESDELLSSIPPKDLKPPRQRPQTSARTAQRLIAQSMGIRLPSNFGTTELRKQEEARKNRIVSRQNMRDDAWGDDGN